MALFGKKKNYSTVKIRKRDIPNGLWVKCPSCQEIIFKQELDNACSVCPKCGHHFPLGRKARLALLVDAATFEEWDADLYSVDTLGFTGVASYASKIEENVKTAISAAIFGYTADQAGRPELNDDKAINGMMLAKTRWALSAG